MNKYIYKIKYRKVKLPRENTLFTEMINIVDKYKYEQFNKCESKCIKLKLVPQEQQAIL